MNTSAPNSRISFRDAWLHLGISPKALRAAVNAGKLEVDKNIGPDSGDGSNYMHWTFTTEAIAAFKATRA